MKKSTEEFIAEGGATCEFCNQRMLKANGCTYTHLECNGKLYPRRKHGEEGHAFPEDLRCHDCGAKVGYYHHFGCDMERCPICGRQLISCDCEITHLHRIKVNRKDGRNGK